MLARRLTQTGREQFSMFLHQLRQDPDHDPPLELLQDDRASAPLDVEIPAEPRHFRSRLEAAEYLHRLLKADSLALRSDSGFWTWLSLAWFNEMCPLVNEHRQPGDVSRWVAELDNPRRACRHLLAGPFQIYRAHRDDPSRAMCLLCSPMHQPGILVSLLASRPSLVTCHAVVGAATRLYYNHATGRNRPGLSRRAPGSPRRFADVLSQLDLTWDLHSLSVDELLDLLPPEFDHFHRASSSAAGPRQRSLLG